MSGCTTYGSTPASNSPTDIVTAIKNIYTDRYNNGKTESYEIRSGSVTIASGTLYINCGLINPDVFSIYCDDRRGVYLSTRLFSWTWSGLVRGSGGVEGFISFNGSVATVGSCPTNGRTWKWYALKFYKKFPVGIIPTGILFILQIL